VATNPAISQGTLVHMADAKSQLRAVRERGGKVVVIDPRRTETAWLASEHHFIRPDTDVFLLLAMTHVILADGLEAKEFLARHVEGVDTLRDMVRPFTPELGAARTGIPADTIRRLAREFAAAPAACAFGRVVCGRFGTLAAWSLEVLNIVTGNLEREDYPVFHTQLMTEPYAQWTEALVPPQGEVKTEWEIFALLSDAMGVPFLNSRVATWMRRGLRLVGLDFSPRWVMDAMIRLGPYGDRYLPWRRGFTLAEVTKHPHGVLLPEPPTGVLGRKLRTPDRKVHL